MFHQGNRALEHIGQGLHFFHEREVVFSETGPLHGVWYSIENAKGCTLQCELQCSPDSFIWLSQRHLPPNRD